jgi:hypothetical protein
LLTASSCFAEDIAHALGGQTDDVGTAERRFDATLWEEKTTKLKLPLSRSLRYET